MNLNIKFTTFCPFHSDQWYRDLSSAGGGSGCPKGGEPERRANSNPNEAAYSGLGFT